MQEDGQVKKILAWHFLADGGRLGYGDDRQPQVGETLSVEGEIKLCERGLHASVNPLDALRYAPGTICCRVELGGKIIRGDDKLVATHRKVLAMADVRDKLVEFACQCAERALHRERDAGREPDPRSWAAIEAVRSFVRGEISQQELDAAADAADAAAAAGRAAAYATAYAAYATAYAAGRAAGRAAARAAAAAYAAYAAVCAADAAEKKWQRETLEKMLNEKLGGI